MTPDRELLADLDADLLPPGSTAAVRAGAGPAELAVLDALAATRRDLAALDDPPVPDEVRERWDAALAAERARHPVDRPGGGPDDRAERGGAAPASGDRHPHPSTTYPGGAGAGAGADGRLVRATGMGGSGRSAAAGAEGKTGAGGTVPEAADAGGRVRAGGAAGTGGEVDGGTGGTGSGAGGTNAGAGGTAGDPPGAAPRRAPRSTGRPRAAADRRRRPARASRTPGRVRLAVVVGVAAAVVGAGALAVSVGPAEPARLDLAAAARSAVGVRDAGALADPARRAGCLAAVAVPGVDPAAPLLAGRAVEVGGRPGVLLVLPGGRLGELRVVVVDPACGPGGGQLLETGVVGG